MDGLLDVGAMLSVIVGRQGLSECLHDPFEGGQIVIDGGLQDRMGRVEVTVGEVVAHPGDLPPRNAGLGGQQTVGQRFDGLPDFEQADPDRVEDQTI